MSHLAIEASHTSIQGPRGPKEFSIQIHMSEDSKLEMTAYLLGQDSGLEGRTVDRWHIGHWNPPNSIKSSARGSTAPRSGLYSCEGLTYARRGLLQGERWRSELQRRQIPNQGPIDSIRRAHLYFATTRKSSRK
ncbi:hypothetical protein BBP40_007347 [Aspergillus hancockii]|nr:hypothetical protein BBP40_007347 [Aspergillus hancockii]